MKVVEISAKKNMLKLDNGQGDSWYKINESNTVGLALAQTLTAGNEVDVKYTVVNGVSVVNDIEKATSPDSPATVAVKEVVDIIAPEPEIGAGNNFAKPATIQKEEPMGLYKCNKCGKAMKDDKYDMCYTCNQEDWKSKNTGGKSAEVNSSIQRQAVGKMTARTVAAMVETCDSTPDTAVVLELIDLVYDKYEEKVKG